MRDSRFPCSLLYAVPVTLILCFACLVAVVYNQVNIEPRDNTPSSGRLIYGLTLLPSGFDPHLNQSAELGIPFMSVYDTLVYRHPQTRAIEKGLAESWSISENGLIYTFYLKRNVTFHDGQPLNSGSVGVNFDRITNPEFGSQKARALLGPFYANYALVDEYTFQIQLTQPYEPLLDGLSQVYLGIASPLALANNTDATYQWNQVGTGPYRVQETVPGDRIVLERNPDYAWGPPFYDTENPNPVQEVEFRFYTDPATRDDALRSGQVGMIGELAPVDVELLFGNSNVRIYPTPIPGQPLQFIFNFSQFPTNDKSIRQALVTSTNRVAIVDAIFAGQSPVAYGPLASATEYYDSSVERFYPYDLEESERLFRLARVSDSDGDGFLDQDGAIIELTILVPPWGLIPEVAQAITDQWAQLGVKVTVDQVPSFPALMSRIAEGSYNLAAIYSFGLDASLLNDYYVTGGTNNWGSYSNQEVDEWLGLALGERDPNTRSSLYAAAQGQIMQDAAILPIREYVNLNGATSKLNGVIFSANGWWPLLPNLQWNQ